MAELRLQIAQAAQHRVPGGLIGYFGADVVDGALTAQFGISTDTGRHRVSIAVGDSAQIADIGLLEVVDVRLGEEGARSRVLVQFTPSAEDRES